jgi:hypothetical protein
VPAFNKTLGSIALIIADGRMPDGNGVDLVRWVISYKRRLERSGQRKNRRLFAREAHNLSRDESPGALRARAYRQSSIGK